MSSYNNATVGGYRLQIARQSASPIEHTLEEGRSVFIGKSDSCGIQVKGDGIAEIHCLIELDGDSVAIQDWASDSGTKINGKSIDEKTDLVSGDSITVGSVTLKLVGKPAHTVSTPSVGVRTRAEELEEESVGMEHLLSDAAESEEELAEQLSAALSPAASRLSEQFQSDSKEPIRPADEPSYDASYDDCEDEPENELEKDILDDVDDELDDAFENGFADSDGNPQAQLIDDADWDPSDFDDEPIDAEIVQLLKDEIEDLRIQLAERDEQIAELEGLGDLDRIRASDESNSEDPDFGGVNLVERVDDLVAELAEHDERVATLQELLQTAEVQNQAEREERYSLESWVTEIEQRMGERESEWHAERDGLRQRIESITQERDLAQQRLHTVAQRYGKSAAGEVVPDEMLKKLQTKNAKLQAKLEASEKRRNALERQAEKLKSEEPESVEVLRAELAKEKADVSRLRFQLSKQLQDIGAPQSSRNEADRELSHKLKTLREHLREIHEEEKHEREQQGESLFGRISSLWKRVDDEF